MITYISLFIALTDDSHPPEEPQAKVVSKGRIRCDSLDKEPVQSETYMEEEPMTKQYSVFGPDTNVEGK